MTSDFGQSEVIMEGRVFPRCLLLRKSRAGQKTLVVRDREFPFHFQTENGREYRVERTKAGKVLMVKVK